MKTRTLWSILVILVSVLTNRPVEGQDHAHSIGSLTQEEVVPMFDRGNTEEVASHFYIHPDTFTRAMNRVYPGLFLENLADFANYIAMLEKRSCSDIVPRGETIPLSRVRNDGSVDLSGAWARGCKPGEVLLCDLERGFCPLSETCWNILLRRVTPPPERPADSAESVDPGPVPLPPATGGLPSEETERVLDLGGKVEVTHHFPEPLRIIGLESRIREEQYEKQGHWYTNPWFWGTAVAAGVAGYFIYEAIDETRVRVENGSTVIDVRTSVQPRPIITIPMLGR